MTVQLQLVWVSVIPVDSFMQLLISFVVTIAIVISIRISAINGTDMKAGNTSA